MAKKKIKRRGGARVSVAVLNRKFRTLSAACVKADKDYIGAEVSVHKALAQAFVLYLELEQRPGALAKIYSKARVQPTGRANNSKFTPFLRVLFRIDLPNPTPADKARNGAAPQSLRNRLSNYAAALEEMDAANEDRPNDFRSRPVQKLIKVIKGGGGVQGAKQARADRNARAKGGQSAGAFADEVEKSKDLISKAALSRLKTTIIGTASFKMPVKVNADALAVVVYQNVGNGKFEALAASNDNAPIEAMLCEAAARIEAVPDLSLRLLGEVIASQSLPTACGPPGSRADASGKYGQFLKSVMPGDRRLAIRDGEFLLSGVGGAPSMVTILKPNQDLRTGKASVCLTDDVLFIEDLIATKTIAAWSASPANGLSKPAVSGKGDHWLDLSNQATRKKRRLKFPAISGIGTAATIQCDLSGSLPKPAWQFTVEVGWLQRLRRTFLDPWLDTTVAGKKLMRAEHQLLKIEVSKTCFKVGYELNETGVNPEEKIELGGADATEATTKRNETFYVSAADFAAVFYNLANRDVDGQIEIAGYDQILLLRFKTALGAYEIAIPTATASDKGARRMASEYLTAYPSAAV